MIYVFEFIGVNGQLVHKECNTLEDIEKAINVALYENFGYMRDNLKSTLDDIFITNIKYFGPNVFDNGRMIKVPGGRHNNEIVELALGRIRN